MRCAVRFLTLIGVAAGTIYLAQAEPPPEGRPWRELLLPRTELPLEHNALARWRPLFPKLTPPNPEITDHLQTLSSPQVDRIDPVDRFLQEWMASVSADISEFCVRQGEQFQFPPLHGPETSFPDHQPLRRLALIRLAALKAAWLDGRHEDAVQLALDNLALARVMLSAQEGLIPLIQSAGVWQLALDGIYWLVQQAALSPSAILRLKIALLNDEKLATHSLARAFRGEFTFFTRLVVDRLPGTRDVNVLLRGINSFGLAPLVPPAEGEPRLAPPPAGREPLDREATLQAAADDTARWIVAVGESRYPRGLAAEHIRNCLRDYARELGGFLRYATEDGRPTRKRIEEADTVIATVENPVGKLFLVLATSRREPLTLLVFRREAQRRALLGLLAWRQFGRPAEWKDLVAAGLLAGPPQDPFGDGVLRVDLKPPRIWSVGANGVDNGGNGAGENIGHPDDYTWPSR
jgi:hypothetical protein